MKTGSIAKKMAIFTVQKNFVKEKKYIFRQKSQSPQNGKNGQKICSFDWSWQLTEYNLHT